MRPSAKRDIGLNELSLNFSFDVELTGFETAEIDLLIGELDQAKPDPADDIEEADRSIPAVTQIGDLWEIGRHRILSGDATSHTSYELLLGAERVQMVFTDPPYNVRVDGHARGLGKIKHHEFHMASGEMTSAEYTAFLKASLVNLAAFTLTAPST